MELTDYNHFSYKELFWIQFNENFISFGGTALGLSKDVHITLSFHSENPNYNLHVTRNKDGELRKPKIEILKVSKELLNQTMEAGMFAYLYTMIEPIPEEELAGYSTESAYVPIEKIEEQTKEILSKNVTVEDYTIRKKTRLKVTADIEKKIMDFSSLEEVISMFQHNQQSIDLPKQPVEGGILIANGKSIPGMYFAGRWYRIKEPMSFLETFSGIIEKETLIRIKWRYNRSMILIKEAKSFDDTSEYNARTIILDRVPTGDNVS